MPLNLLSAVKEIVGWASLPVKSLLALSLACLAASTPWITDRIHATAALAPALVWIRSGAGFFGICLAVNVVWNAVQFFGPSIGMKWTEYAMDRRICKLTTSEKSLVRNHLGDNVRQCYLNKNPEVLSLVSKGSLARSDLNTGVWTDQLAYELTPRANASLRKKSVWKHFSN